MRTSLHLRSADRVGLLRCAVATGMLACVAGGCTMARITGHGSLPVLLNSPGSGYEVIDHVTVRKRFVFDYTRSIDVSAILVPTLSGSRYAEASAIANVKVVWKTTPVDFLLNVVTLTFAAAQTVEVSGDVIRARPEARRPPPEEEPRGR